MIGVSHAQSASRHTPLTQDGRRSASGASTASNDTGLDQAQPHADARYAPFRPLSQPTQSAYDDSRTSTPLDSHHMPFDAAGFAASLSQYNTGQPGQADRMSFDATQSQLNGALSNTQVSNLARRGSRAGSTAAGTDTEKKERKGGNNTQANEKELRDLIERNHGRTLDSIARDVRNAERTQKSEKAKQLFAMRWLREYCRASSQSVPRNRVYTNYALRCGTDRVDTLNPASFGKLVRIIFPGIQTRRLGVRGESKYHYVSLSLIEDQPNNRPRSAQSTADLDGDVSMQQDEFPYVQEISKSPSPTNPEQTCSVSSRLPADTAAFPGPEVTSYEQPPPPVISTNPSSQGRLFAPANSPTIPSEGPAKLYRQVLQFSTKDDSFSSDDALKLPPIRPFVPSKTDTDIAEALAALYRTHCVSLVDSVRFVKEKQFTRLLGSYNGTMTVPVSKLFQQASLAPWIKACDQIMYQAIIRFVSQLALQVIPTQVLNMLRNLSRNLTGNLHKHFGHFPEHVVNAKIESATVFASLVERLLRVNETAHAAANLLMNDEMRNMMWMDWVKNVRPKRVAESALSHCGHAEVYRVLTSEMRHLLSPLNLPDFDFETNTEYENSNHRADWMDRSDDRTESIIERWATFLQSIPSRFPRVETKMLMHCVESVGSACLRDITVAQAQSFGAWWITKVWIDEMMLWMAESGGFLTPPLETAASPTRSDQFDSFIETEQQETQPNTQPDRAESTGARPDSAGLGINFDALPSFTPLQHRQRQSSGPPTATFRFSTSKSSHLKSDAMTFELNDAHDDSGIGMSLLHDGSPNGFPAMTHAR